MNETCLKEKDIDRAQDGYERFLPEMQDQFNKIISMNGAALFTTNATGIFQTFLDALPEESRQHYTCHACRHFIDKFGGLVSIDESGKIVPVMWLFSEVPGFFQGAVHAIEHKIYRSKVTGVFFSKDKEWGTPVTGEWHHMHIIPHSDMIHRKVTQTAFQTMAEKREDFKMLINCLKKYSSESVAQAITLLKTESLYRSEKCLGVAEWFKAIHAEQKAETNSQIRTQLLWKAVSIAPPGFCHINGSMIGTLLDDIIDGLDFEFISKRFADKMHPLQYQRPQAPPSAGNVAQAEKIFEQMGVAASLVRRFARLEELKTIWAPKKCEAPKENTGCVFSHLKTKNSTDIKPVSVPPVTITWEKFNRTILPDADQINFCVPYWNGNFGAILTASDLDAPPILQWDSEEHRNPFSWYLYNSGSAPSSWGLTPSTKCNVSGICLKPSMWFQENSHQGTGVFFILDGAKDSKYERAGNAIFPETLKSEFHGIRSTIEAYSKSATIQGYNESTACGIIFSGGEAITFEVTASGITVPYKIDRMD